MNRLVAMTAAAAGGFTMLTIVVWRRWAPAVQWDAAGHLWAITHRSDATIALARAVTEAGSTYVVMPVVVVLGFLAVPRRRLIVRIGVGALLGSVAVLGAVLGLAVNAAVNGVRPGEQDWAGAAGGPTYPSGHTTVSTILAAAVAWTIWARSKDWRLAAPAVGIALAVGWSRVWLGVHWPSDVAGGWLFGLFWAGLALAVAESARRRRVTRRRRDPAAAYGPADPDDSAPDPGPPARTPTPPSGRPLR